jgi:hypothetical protein
VTPRLEHTVTQARNSEPVAQAATADEDLLARRRAILAEHRRVQTRCERELRRLGADYAAVMHKLCWPSGCVTRSRRTA